MNSDSVSKLNFLQHGLSVTLRIPRKFSLRRKSVVLFPSYLMVKRRTPYFRIDCFPCIARHLIARWLLLLPRDLHVLKANFQIFLNSLKQFYV